MLILHFEELWLLHVTFMDLSYSFSPLTCVPSNVSFFLFQVMSELYAS